MYREFLSTLELRKQQLQAELRDVEQHIRERRMRLDSILAAATSMAPMLRATLGKVRTLVKVAQVLTHIGNVARNLLLYFFFQSVPVKIEMSQETSDDRR